MVNSPKPALEIRKAVLRKAFQTPEILSSLYFIVRAKCLVRSKLLVTPYPILPDGNIYRIQLAT